MSNISGRGFLVGLLFALVLSPAPAVRAGEFCSDSGCTATRQLFKQLCDFIAEKKNNVPIIYTGEYYGISCAANAAKRHGGLARGGREK
jgi:hypothetical protein